MTIGIAALADRRTKIVMASDSKAAFGDFSADRGVLKNIPIGHYYAILVAGNDTGYIMPTVKRIQKAMPLEMTDPDEIAMLIHEELAETRKRKIEAKILAKLGFTMDTFRTEGKELLTESVYYDLVSEIRREELSLTFLLAGFDASNHGHLRVITSDDCPQDYDMLGFAAIGSGASPALASLTFARDHNMLLPTEDFCEVASHVLAAKFAAESATDVGHDTFYVCNSPKGVCHFLSGFKGGVETVRTSWHQYGAPKRSPETIQLIRDLTYSGRDPHAPLEAATNQPEEPKQLTSQTSEDRQ
ncbi:MAG TPA: hypothetical protein VGG56_13790 [Terracidiphilus sp.]|jgi:20S proteasome alpha/beta subunit